MKSFLKTERLCQLLALAIGARCVFLAKSSAAAVGVDGICYLEVARAYLKHDWHTAINGYWGPLYSWLLAIGMAIFHSTPASELPVAEAMNFAIFAACVAAFGACWRAIGKQTVRESAPGTSIVEICPGGWTVCGYLLFVTPAVWYVGSMVPDLVVATIVFAIVATLLWLEDGADHSIAAYVAFGMLLALGYYAKVVLFYFGSFLLVGLLLRHVKKRSFARPSVAIITFLIAVSPFAFVLSKTLGRFTIGDAGRLNYAWLADAPETKNWLTGKPGAASLPFFPGPLLHENPQVFRLPILPGVTYAAFYDASRYDLRNHPHFSFSPQVRRVAVNLRPFAQVVIGAEGVFILLLCILVLYAPREFRRNLSRGYLYSIPILATISMYVLVFLVWRYLLAFSPLLWGTALAAVSIPIRWRDTIRPIFLATVVVFLLQAGPGLVHFLAQRGNSADREVAVAEFLSQSGVKPGDTVAILGEGQSAWWAHLAGLSLSAEVWPADIPQFWASSPEEQREILGLMIGTGAKAVVWRRDSDQLCPATWQPLPQYSGCVFVPKKN